MYVNKCIKCGKEFETKNPKRVICPDCLYSDKKYTEELSNEAAKVSSGDDDKIQRNSYSFGDDSRNERPYRSFNDRGDRGDRGDRNDRWDRNDRNGFDRGDRNSFSRNNRGFLQRDSRNRTSPQGGYQKSYGNNRYQDNRGGQRPQRQGGFNNRQNGFNNRPGSFNNRPQRGGAPKPKRQKQLLVSKEQLEQIEILYKKALPLPNPDVHEVIGQAIGLEPRKVFFGINLVRQKLMLPKLPFPKRKLAVSPDQLFAIKNLYEPLLPLPPIGCHKIIAVQLKMDEWRVHVGIGLIRKQMGLDRWNQEREDAPEEYKKTK